MLKNQAIRTSHAPTPGNYSQGMLVDARNRIPLYTCGQTGDDPVTGLVVSGGITPQTLQALTNLHQIIRAAGGELSDIAKVTVYMENMARNKEGFEEAYTSFMVRPFPPRSLVEVSCVPLPGDEAVVEIDAVAYVHPQGFK